MKLIHLFYIPIPYYGKTARELKSVKDQVLTPKTFVGNLFPSYFACMTVLEQVTI